MIIAAKENGRTVTMAEYYELVLNHRVQNGGRYDPYLEQPVIVKCFVSPLVRDSADINSEALIDEMCHKIKEYWILTRKDGDGNG